MVQNKIVQIRILNLFAFYNFHISCQGIYFEPRTNCLFGNKCGERGIRTPGPVTVNGFQDRRIRPLCHLSNGVQKYAIRMSFAKSNEKVFDSIPKPVPNHHHPSKYQYDTHCLIFGTQFDPQTPTCIGCNQLPQ